MVIVGGIALLTPAAADETVTMITAQLDCASLPRGPARTDCYIASNMRNRQEFEIAEGTARRSKDIARHHKAMGLHPNAKPRAARQ